MTPKRYFAFGCITILIQGGVLASQISESSIRLSEGAAMGSNQAVSVVIAMQATTQVQSTVIATQAATETIKAITTKPITKAVTPEPKVVLKPSVKPRAMLDDKHEKITVTAEMAHTPRDKSAVEDEPITTDMVDLALANTTNLASHNPLESTLAQPSDVAPENTALGVTKQTVVLPQPTFSTPPTQPYYPKAARKRGFEGTATVEVMFNQIGEQLSLTLVDSSGYNLLDAAAISAVEQWQFSAPSPQTAFAYTVRVPVKFALN